MNLFGMSLVTTYKLGYRHDMQTREWREREASGKWWHTHAPVQDTHDDYAYSEVGHSAFNSRNLTNEPILQAL